IFNQSAYSPIGYGPNLEDTLLARPDGASWVRRYRQSALEVVNDYFEDDHCRTFMLWLAFMTIQPVDRPYTGRLAYAIVNVRQYNSWATPVGGSGMLPKALTALIEDHGGSVLAGKAVRELVLENGACVGVITEDGETHRAHKAVVSTIHVKHLTEMAPRAAW